MHLVFTKCTFLELNWNLDWLFENSKTIDFDFQKSKGIFWREKSTLIKSKKSTLYNQIPNPLKLPSSEVERPNQT